MSTMSKRRYMGIALIVSSCFLGCNGVSEIRKTEEIITPTQEEVINPRVEARAMGIDYLEQMEYEQAILCFEEALQLSNGFLQEFDYDVNAYLAIAYIKNNELEKAMNVYDAILALREDAQIYFYRGILHMQNGNVSSATGDFEQAIKLDEKNYELRIQIYEIYKENDKEEVGALYLRSIMTQEVSISAYDKGKMYYHLGEYENAYLSLELAKDLQNPDTYLYLGKAYAAAGEYNLAIKTYQVYIEYDQTNATLYNQLGLCHLVLKDYLAALEAFQAGLEYETIASNVQVLEYNEMITYEYLNEYDKAQELMVIYRNKYPDDEDAKREYDFLMTR